MADQKRFTALIIGECGMGKSTLVYNLAGRPEVDSQLDGTEATGVTKEFTGYDADLRGLNQSDDIVIDTPGIGDQTVRLTDWVAKAERAFQQVNAIICCVSECNPRITLGSDLVTNMINRGFLGDVNRAKKDPQLFDLLCNAVIVVGTKGNLAMKKMRRSMQKNTAPAFAKKCGLEKVKYIAIDAGDWEEPDSGEEDETPMLEVGPLQSHLAKLKGMIDDLEASGKCQHSVMKYVPIKKEELIDMCCCAMGVELTDEDKRRMAEELNDTCWRASTKWFQSLLPSKNNEEFQNENEEIVTELPRDPEVRKRVIKQKVEEAEPWIIDNIRSLFGVLAEAIGLRESLDIHSYASGSSMVVDNVRKVEIKDGVLVVQITAFPIGISLKAVGKKGVGAKVSQHTNPLLSNLIPMGSKVVSVGGVDVLQMKYKDILTLVKKSQLPLMMAFTINQEIKLQNKIFSLEFLDTDGDKVKFIKKGDVVSEYVNGNIVIDDLSWFQIKSDGGYIDTGGYGTIPAENLESVRNEINQFFIEVCHWELVEENDELHKWKKTKKIESQFKVDKVKMVEIKDGVLVVQISAIKMSIQPVGDGFGAEVSSHDNPLLSNLIPIGSKIVKVQGVNVLEMKHKDIATLIRKSRPPLTMAFTVNQNDTMGSCKCPEEHEMVLTYGTPPAYGSSSSVTCNVCSEKRIQSLGSGFYHCRPCGYDICMKCARKKSTIKQQKCDPSRMPLPTPKPMPTPSPDSTPPKRKAKPFGLLAGIKGGMKLKKAEPLAPKLKKKSFLEELKKGKKLKPGMQRKLKPKKQAENAELLAKLAKYRQKVESHSDDDNDKHDTDESDWE